MHQRCSCSVSLVSLKYIGYILTSWNLLSCAIGSINSPQFWMNFLPNFASFLGQKTHRKPRGCMSGTKPVYSPAARMELSSPRGVEGTWLTDPSGAGLWFWHLNKMASFLQIHLVPGSSFNLGMHSEINQSSKENTHSLPSFWSLFCLWKISS